RRAHLQLHVQSNGAVCCYRDTTLDVLFHPTHLDRNLVAPRREIRQRIDSSTRGCSCDSKPSVHISRGNACPGNRSITGIDDRPLDVSICCLPRGCKDENGDEQPRHEKQTREI